jgi:hypothetical protein
MSLQQFLVDNRTELVKRTRAKVAERPSPQPSEADVEHGVPLFLSQLVAALRTEGQRDPTHAGSSTGSNANIGEYAALHGRSLRKFGFTIGQVVQGYGDICQAVTELAEVQGAVVTVAEFHTLNRCLDAATAAAVSSWTKEAETSLAEGKGQPDFFRSELSALVDIAATSFGAIRAGLVANGGITGALVQDCLAKMRSLLDDPERVEHKGAGAVIAPRHAPCCT